MCCIGRWTVDELKDLISLLQQADFDPTDVDTDMSLIASTTCVTKMCMFSVQTTR